MKNLFSFNKTTLLTITTALLLFSDITLISGKIFKGIDATTKNFEIASYRIRPESYHLFSRGIQLFIHKKYEEAADIFEEVIQLDPEHSRAWYERGLALYKIGDYENAIKSLEGYIPFREEDPCSYYFISMSHDGLGNDYLAQESLELALRLAEGHNLPMLKNNCESIF